MSRGARFVETASRIALILGPGSLLLLLLWLVLGSMISAGFGSFGGVFEVGAPIHVASMLAVALGSLSMAVAQALARRPSTATAALIASAAGALCAVLAIGAAFAAGGAWRPLLRVAFAAGSLGVAAAAIGGLDAIHVPSAPVAWLRSLVRILVACWLISGLALCALAGNAHLAAWRHRDAVELATVASVAMLLLGAVASAGLAAVLLRLCRRRALPAESIASKVALELDCPRCEVRQTLGTGHVRCGACGFAMRIEVEEPRCECGYLLFRIEGDRCPECGRAVERPAACPPQ